MNIYEVAYYGWDDYKETDNFSLLFSHENKYTDQQFQEILDEILSDYELLIVLNILKKEEPKKFDENYMNHITHASGNKSSLLSCFPDEVEEILIEKYDFKKYTPSITAKAYASVIEDEEDYSEYHGC